MNIFSSDKAPYILGLLVTVISWHVSQIGNETTKTQAVTYSLNVNHETGEVVALIRNVSRTKSLVKATFSLACLGGRDCLAPLRAVRHGETPVYGEVRAIAPNAIASDAVPGGNEPHAVALINTVAAGGRYQIVARLTDRDRGGSRRYGMSAWFARPNLPFEFFFIPDENRPLDILIYDSQSITGFLIENYFRILIFSFLLFSALLIFSISSNFRSRNEPIKQEGDDGNCAPRNGPSGAADRSDPSARAQTAKDGRQRGRGVHE